MAKSSNESTKRSVSQRADNDCIIVRQDSTLYLEFAADIKGSLNNIELVDNAEQCRAMLNVQFKWSVDAGKTWSEPGSVYDAATHLNEFVLAYATADEPVHVKFIMIVDVAWRKQWTDAANVRHDSYMLEDIKVNEESVDNVTYADEILAPTKQASIVIESDNHLYNPYTHMQDAIALQDNIVNAVNRQLGHVVIWFSHEVSDEHRVASLRAYDLIHTGAVKWLKLMVVDNEFSTNKVTYDAFDIDFEQGITAHVPKAEYERVFGIGKQPQQFDYCYVPIANRMLEVASVQHPDGIMLSTPYYELTLKSYEHRPEYRDESKMQVADDVKELLNLDELTKTFDAFDADKIATEQVEDIALNMFANDTHVDLSMYETNRRFVHKAVSVNESPLSFKYVPVSAAFYDMNAVGNDIAVEYVKSLDASDWSACCLFMLEDNAKAQAASWQLMRLGRLMLVVSSGLLHVLDVKTGESLASVDDKICKSWNGVVIRLRNLGNGDVELVLSLSTSTTVNDMQILTEVVKSTSILHDWSNDSDIVQLYGFAGKITHIRVDKDSCRSTLALLMQQQPFEATLIADDAQQVYKGSTAMLVGDASMTKQQTSKSSEAFLKSDAYAELDKSHVWLCSHNNFKSSVNVKSNTLWHVR